MICTALDHPMERPSPVAGICVSCFNHLPKVTRDLYARGELSVRRVGELARLRNASYNDIRPPRHTQK